MIPRVTRAVMAEAEENCKILWLFVEACTCARLLPWALCTVYAILFQEALKGGGGYTSTDDSTGSVLPATHGRLSAPQRITTPSPLSFLALGPSSPAVPPPADPRHPTRCW